MGLRRLSIFCRTTPVPKVNDPKITGALAVITERCREYPGVFALATLLEVVAISCWLTERALNAIERDPLKPDMGILLPGAGVRSAALRDRACRWARNSPPHDSLRPDCARGGGGATSARVRDDGCGPQAFPTRPAGARIALPRENRWTSQAMAEHSVAPRSEAGLRGAPIAGKALPGGPRRARLLPHRFAPTPGCLTPDSSRGCAPARAAARSVC